MADLTGIFERSLAHARRSREDAPEALVDVEALRERFAADADLFLVEARSHLEIWVGPGLASDHIEDRVEEVERTLRWLKSWTAMEPVVSAPLRIEVESLVKQPQGLLAVLPVDHAGNP